MLGDPFSRLRSLTGLKLLLSCNSSNRVRFLRSVHHFWNPSSWGNNRNILQYFSPICMIFHKNNQIYRWRILFLYIRLWCNIKKDFHLESVLIFPFQNLKLFIYIPLFFVQHSLFHIVVYVSFLSKLSCHSPTREKNSTFTNLHNLTLPTS